MNLIPAKLKLGIARTLMSGFDAGSRTITRIKNWLPANTEINALITYDGDLMRARARKLARENPWAKGAIDCFVSNCIGTGIVPRSLHPDTAMRKTIRDAWDRWVKESDANGMQDFYGLQATACRAIRTDGEVFARIRLRRASDAMHVPLQIQLLEADYVPYWKIDDTANFYTRAGIQFNLIGQRELYWMYRDHPGSMWNKDGALYPIPAEQVLHCFDVQRPGQLRGQPWMTAAIIMLYDIKQLTDAALLRQKVCNLLSVWIKRGPSGDGMLGETDNGDGTAIAGLTPGSINYLNQGEEPTFLDPKEAGVGFETFIKSMLRAVARALGITYEQLTGDLSGVNFSSIRAGLNEFQRWCEAWQYQVMIYQFCEQIWPVWIQQAILAGVLGDGAAAEYAKTPQNFINVKWTPPGWKYVNPIDDIRAAQLAIRSGLQSRDGALAAQGLDSETIDAENASDNQRADELGLIYDSDARNPLQGPRVTEAAGPSDPVESEPATPPTPIDKKKGAA